LSDIDDLLLGKQKPFVSSMLTDEVYSPFDFATSIKVGGNLFSTPFVKGVAAL
jgi:hypothetical protein